MLKSPISCHRLLLSSHVQAGKRADIISPSDGMPKQRAGIDWAIASPSASSQLRQDIQLLNQKIMPPHPTHIYRPTNLPTYFAHI